MTASREFQPVVFGVVDIEAEHGLFSIDTAAGGACRLTLVARTERGYPRRELAAIPGAIWKQVASSALRELLRDMDPEEHGPKPLSFKAGENALSPLIVRELAVLLWALMEDGEGTHTDALLAGWRQLAREERWWLYARASNPTQRQGQGWRRALYFALTDPADTRTAPRLLEILEAASAQKKTSMSLQPVNYLDSLRKERAEKRRQAKASSAPKSGPLPPKIGKDPGGKSSEKTSRRREPAN